MADAQVQIDRLIIKINSGRRANEVLVFSSSELDAGITIGRDIASQVLMDATEDEVSRQHARFEKKKDSAYDIQLLDLNSSNGTFVNQKKVEGTASVTHGDVVRLGLTGPILQIEFDPEPPEAHKATRVVNISASHTPTRQVQIPEAAQSNVAVVSAPLPTEPSVESTNAPTSRKLTYLLVVGVAALLAAGGLYQYLNRPMPVEAQATPPQGPLSKEAAQQIKNSADVAARVVSQYGPSTVQIETSWRLIETQSGKQVYHAYFRPPSGGVNGVVKPVPMYAKVDGKLEPVVTISDGGGLNKPIGGVGGQGTGFVVSEDGFLLTNKHVAAPWTTRYSHLEFPGVIVKADGRGGIELEALLRQANGDLAAWVPNKAALLGGNVFQVKLLEGVNDTLDVTFNNDRQRIRAKISSISQEHDVALLKIDIPSKLTKMPLLDNFDNIQVGSDVALLGFPGLSPNPLVLTQSGEIFSQGSKQVSSVPVVSVNKGIVSKVIRGKSAVADASAQDYVSTAGEVLQLSINSTGPGNSGGPLFDTEGNVIGILTYGGQNVTFATPIKYGIRLMGPQQVLK